MIKNTVKSVEGIKKVKHRNHKPYSGNSSQSTLLFSENSCKLK